MALILLKRLSDEKPFTIDENELLVLESTASGTNVEYIDPISGYVDKIEVSNPITDIATISDQLFEITPIVTGKTVYINYEKVLNIMPYGASNYAKILYDRGGTNAVMFETLMSVASVYTNIYTKKGYLTYEVDSYTATTIVLKAAEGDVTTTMTNPKILTLYGSTDSNNGTYEIQSSAFGGGQTTITLPAASIADTGSTVGFVMVKS